ncbi:MAG: phosphate/phosphite/phosphonate ABC transporter substrate-binding protein [Gammaproteobacteria bacterium]|nr:phosphate/phosphite/phosphonate ABC transporter substrate-binding protein [Gammaproteobacteria bacterium]
MNEAIKYFSIIFLSMLTLTACGKDASNSQDASAKQSVTNESAVTRLRVGFPPDENPKEIIRKNQPLMEYLKKETGIKEIDIVVPETYTAAVEEMGKGNLDVVYFGGLTYVLAKSELDITPFARGTAEGTPENFSLIIARVDSNISSLQDLKGKSFAFGDVASTSGHLIPHKGLLNVNIDPNKDMKSLVYTGAHDKTALAVFNREVDAGAMNARLFPKMVARGQLDKSKLVILWKSDPFADYPWAARSNLGPEVIAKLRDAFVNLKDPSLLSLLGVEGYESTSDKDFDNIRQAAQALGFMGD